METFIYDKISTIQILKRGAHFIFVAPLFLLGGDMIEYCTTNT